MGRRLGVIGAGLILAALLLGLADLLRADRSPARWTGGNLLPNADWSAFDETTGRPAGWSGVTLKRVDGTSGYVLDAPYALKLDGVSSSARSPEIKAAPGQRYRLGLRALFDPGQQAAEAPARLQVWIHWIDAAGDDIQIDK
ncbi:MAG TPA: hypothetical protein VGE07_14640, partial [Herpetosiphonaceae bacterium]